jgi:protease-4
VLIVVFRLLRALFRLLLWPLLAVRRTRGAGPSGWIALTLEGSIADVVPPRPFWARRARPRISLYAIEELSRELALDPRARGLVVTLKDARFGMATATSLRELFARLREAGSKVVVHLPYGGDTKACFVAAAASEVYVGPQATLAPYGFAVTTPYGRDALARLGVVPEVLARGKYKSAGESLVRDAMSDAQKEQLGALLDGFHHALQVAFANGRGVDEARAAKIIDEAPYIGEGAVLAGLVDAALYDDAVTERLAPAPTGQKRNDAKKTFVSASAYLARRRFRLGPILSEPVIAVVRVHGAIVQSGGTPLVQTTDERVVRAIGRARTSQRVLGVVLHIDSPGGSALASDRIHHELVRLAADKPLVACMANVAASGGYYVAAAAHSIVAEPTTITGSIGVVAARFAVEPLLARLGVHTEVVTRGARAGLLHPTRPLTDEERAVLQGELETVYRAFVRVVADGRKKSEEEIDALAQGRVWSGVDAHARGLVDELGGFTRALEVVRSRIGAGASRAVPVVFEPPSSLASRASGLAGASPALPWLLGDEGAETLAALAFSATRERVLAWTGLAFR